ncbi:MAG: phosphate acyltransferase PlsX [Deltaproteobacteria bacterium]|nr:phosphate acyltransferase PlsX [Deltaproteobacteria bacterium]
MLALDAMGGDFAPSVTVEGALRARRERGIEAILVGDEPRLKAELKRLDAGPTELRIQHASQVVEMAEHPGQALRKKKDSSLRVCFDLCKAGQADGLVSAGNSGAVLAGGLFVFGRLDGVDRACIGGTLPSLGGAGRAVLVDMGANVECTPLQLVQFALMGEVMARHVLHLQRPRIGVVANGEEDGKGTDLTRAVATALRRPEAGIQFSGYCEGKDVFSGDFDVIVTDGFTGNVLLKTAEGAVWAFAQLLKQQIKASAVATAGALLMRSALEQVKRKVDHEEVGAAPLLGVQGTALVAHGRSSARAIENALASAQEFAGFKMEADLAKAALKAATLL